jgi:hypothetical protein
MTFVAKSVQQSIRRLLLCRSVAVQTGLCHRRLLQSKCSTCCPWHLRATASRPRNYELLGWKLWNMWRRKFKRKHTCSLSRRPRFFLLDFLHLSGLANANASYFYLIHVSKVALQVNLAGLCNGSRLDLCSTGTWFKSGSN